jgi:hypothetical protein
VIAMAAVLLTNKLYKDPRVCNLSCEAISMMGDFDMSEVERVCNRIINIYPNRDEIRSKFYAENHLPSLDRKESIVCHTQSMNILSDDRSVSMTSSVLRQAVSQSSVPKSGPHVVAVVPTLQQASHFSPRISLNKEESEDGEIDECDVREEIDGRHNEDVESGGRVIDVDVGERRGKGENAENERDIGDRNDENDESGENDRNERDLIHQVSSGEVKEEVEMLRDTSASKSTTSTFQIPPRELETNEKKLKPLPLPLPMAPRDKKMRLSPSFTSPNATNTSPTATDRQQANHDPSHSPHSALNTANMSPPNHRSTSPLSLHSHAGAERFTSPTTTSPTIRNNNPVGGRERRSPHSPNSTDTRLSMYFYSSF